MPPHFQSAAEMSDHQLQREVAEALRVQDMNPVERLAWLRSAWTPLQVAASSLMGSVDALPPGHVRVRVHHFATMAEKNAFDLRREIEAAVRLAERRDSEGANFGATPSGVTKPRAA